MRAESAPEAIDVDRQAGVTVTWPDGFVARWGLAELRARCPCAACRSLRERGLPLAATEPLQPPLAILDAELVGGWGLSITWNDGHSTGIYSWSLLREWPDSYPDQQ